MKIAFLVGNFPSLTETFILNQITGLLDRGQHVDIFATSGKYKDIVQSEVLKYNLLLKTHYRYNLKRIFRSGFDISVRNFRKPLRTLNFLKYGSNASCFRLFFDSLHLLKNGPYDIVHSHFATKNILGPQLKNAGIINGKLISTFYGYDITGFIKKNGKDIYDILFKEADLITVIVKQWKKKLVDLGCDPEKIITQRIGIKAENFHMRNTGNDSVSRILSIARFVEKKGIEYGLRAFAKVNRKNPGVTYEIVGEGPLKKKLKLLVDRLGIKEKVNFLGRRNRNEIIEIIKKSDIFLAPSVTAGNGDQEGTPVVLMEAMASGLPIVSTLHGGISELIKDGVSGFLVDERNSAALANKIELLIQNPKLRKDFGEKGRKDVLEKFNSNKLNDNLLNIYQGLLRKS
jgi:colanic acid/amylovoran biosynthesis glycosyltransferase